MIPSIGPAASATRELADMLWMRTDTSATYRPSGQSGRPGREGPDRWGSFVTYPLTGLAANFGGVVPGHILAPS